MGKENKSYRIRTTVGKDSVINFSVDNTVDTLEVLSLKISQDNAYRLMGSDTGVVAGRVLANGGFGVPNVRVSVFIPYEDTDNIEQRVLYTYTGTSDRGGNGVRYNLLPDNVDDACHQNIGTFPSKRVLLDNNNWIDIFDKYYKFTTRTNEAGDYMIYGVPVGNQTIHMDADMSDIGVLSQKPRDMIYNGYDGNMFESPTKFKVDVNIDSLAQVRTQDQTVYVYPFWGDTTESNINASITRCDMNINYKFEPTCVFMGSVITDTGENAMTKKCVGAKNQGRMSDMITGEGRIEMIRKTPNGQVEQFSVNGDNNINGDGVWCYQIPMNLDYVMHDEFGKMVMSDNPNIGIPTRARVRFRLSMSESPSDAIARKRARFLIPNNPRLVDEDYPDYCETKEIDYEFGTKTKNENFRDLFWNNVYTVKSYIPRLQKSRLPNNLRHLGIKTVNHPGGHNPMPFNNLRIKFNFTYMFLCTLVKVLVTFVGAINSVLTFISWIFLKIGYFFVNAAKAINIPIAGKNLLDGVAKIFAAYHGHGVRDDESDNKKYAAKVWEDMQNGTKYCEGIASWFIRIFLGIGCGIELKGLCETDEGEPINVSPGTYDNAKDELSPFMSCNDSVDALYNCIENQLAQDNEVTQFNFYNDWVNGVVYLPLWYRKIKKRRNGSVKKDEWCSTDNSIDKIRIHKKNLRLYNTNIPKRTFTSGGPKTMGVISPLANNEDTVNAYANSETGIETLSFKEKNDENCYGYQCHKFSRTYFKIYKGLVYEKLTMLGDRVYYYKPCDYDPSTGNSDLVTLFATDLVLLGSLNDCDAHGIPQFFKTLESTTYNMPPDLLSEYYDYTDENNQAGNDENDSQEIDLGSRITEYTGADWGNLGVDQSNYNEELLTILGTTFFANANENQYDNGGLFYGLTCFDSYTKPKSCINLSRICELGVSLDESNELPSAAGTSTDNDTDTLTPDGFISYDDIYNPDYRSMFATLNANFLKTKLNPETGLLVYDLNHMYVDNFDGSLNQLMRAKTVNGYTEKSNFEEKANYANNYNLEHSSDTYLDFRYGNYTKRNGNKIYFYENNNSVGHAGFANILGPTINGKNRQPRYENSFYFYFGLNEGKTAIDKFNNEFFSDCTSKFASDVPYTLTYKGNNWCPIDSGDGFIAFEMNIEGPYSVKFTNNDTNDVYFRENISEDKFIFCGAEYMPEGYSRYTRYGLEAKIMDSISDDQNTVNIIPNGTYSVKLTDGYDNVYEDRITFELPRIGFVCDVNPFNRKNAELMERFKDAGELISDTYADIANHARFVDDNMVIDMDALTYSLYETGFVIKRNSVYYIKTNAGFRPYVATSDITVTADDNNYYYYHEPRLDRDIRGFVSLSEMTEDDFRIDFKPIDTDFFGDNYIGTSVSVHVTYDLYSGSVIPAGETYFINDNGEYKPMVAQTDIENDSVSYFEADVSVTENHSTTKYVRFNENDVIPAGYKYYTKSGDEYIEWTASDDITVGVNDEYYHKVDICGYLGHIIYGGTITYYFGAPYGGQKYRITVTQLCECGSDVPGAWCDTDNVTILNVIVYEDEFKMYINGIDYDLIQKFKTGWTDSQLKDGVFEDEGGAYSSFDKDKIYGWTDILNIGTYNYENSVKYLVPIKYDTSLDEIIEICKVLNTNYNGNATGEGENETPYVWLDTYCYNAPSYTYDYYNKGQVGKTVYSYTLAESVACLYDVNGQAVSADGIVRGTTYYIDAAHTIEAEIGTDYFETVSETQVDVERYDSQTTTMEYADNEYLLDGDSYIYKYPFDGHEERTGTVDSGYDGIRVSVLRATLRIADDVVIYKNEGGVGVQVSSLELTDGVHYYVNSACTIDAVSGTHYVLEPPAVSYALEIPLYRAEYKESETGPALVEEDNYGVLTYHTEDNTEYYDLSCITYFEYRDFIDTINATISRRKEMAREVAGAFRINEDETTMTVTTKTKAKPVRYLIVGSSEISVSEKTYEYKPIAKKTPVIIEPLSFNSMADINNTKYVSATSVKNISDGYVVDKNLETPSVTFSLPTLTYDYDFVKYNDDDHIYNNDVYYSEEVVAYPPSSRIPSGTWYYDYGTDAGSSSKYYKWTQATSDIVVPSEENTEYFYITGNKIKHTAYIISDFPFIVKYRNVSDFVKDAHTTSRIFKIGNGSYVKYVVGETIPAGDTYYERTGSGTSEDPYVYTQRTAEGDITVGVNDEYYKKEDKEYLPYNLNKYKHPYYVSVMNDNDSIIPPGNDFSDFTDLGDDKKLDTTFGVHFYNKPLKGDFKMAFAFINNIPAYPKHALGDDSYIGTAYSLNSYKYYRYTYPDDDQYAKYAAGVVIAIGYTYYTKDEGGGYTQNVADQAITVQTGDEYYYIKMITEGTVIYATVDNNEPSDIVLLEEYYCYVVGSALTTPIPYQPGEIIPKGWTYYTEFESTYIQQTADNEITVGENDNYFRKNEKISEIKGRMPQKQNAIVKLYAYNFVNSLNNLNYTVYDGDIIYVESQLSQYLKYSDGDTISEGGTYYIKTGEDVYTQTVAAQAITVEDGDEYYYKNEYINISYNRHVVSLSETKSKMSLIDYCSEQNLDYSVVYYPDKSNSIISDVTLTGITTNSTTATKDIDIELTARYVLVDRVCNEYNGSQWEEEDENIGEYGYPIGVDCLKDDNNTKKTWCVKKTSNAVTYNNYGEYRYYGFGDYTYSVNLTKRTTECTIEPVYQKNDTTSTYTRQTQDYEPYGNSERIPRNTYVPIKYESGNPIPEGYTYYTRSGSGPYVYTPVIADHNITVGGSDEYYHFTVSIKYMVDDVIATGDTYYERTGNGTSADPYVYTPAVAAQAITVGGSDEYYHLTTSITQSQQITYYKLASYELIAPGKILPIGSTYYDRASIDSLPTQFTKKTVPLNSINVPRTNTDSGTPKYYYGTSIENKYDTTDINLYRGVYGCSNGLFDFVPFYGEIVSTKKITDDWQPVNVFMPGFLSGYFYNGIPRSGENPDDTYDNSNITAELNENEIKLYTPTNDNDDVHKNINVRRLLYTPNDTYSPDYPATYGKYKIETNQDNNADPLNSLDYQYIELPLVDDEIIYTDTYGDDYRKRVYGTLSLKYVMPVFTYFNLGKTREYVKKHLDYEDYIVANTFFTADDGYVLYQTLYYVYDLEKTEYPLLYYKSGTDTETEYDSNLKYDKDQDRFYFDEMPEILKDINNSNYISKSKSTHFNVWEYLRNKYGQQDTDTSTLPLDIARPHDKFFVIACVDGYYTISPVIETQKFRVVLNYNGFDNRNGSPVYITCRDSRKRTTDAEMSGNVHYIEDMYYMLYYRFVIHVASFDYEVDDDGNQNAKYNSDVYTQICSVPEGTAEHCYIKVVDNDDDITYWASAIKVNLSSIGSDVMGANGQILDWLQIIIEDISTGTRVAYRQMSGDDPNKGVDVTEFEDYDAMIADYESNQS